MIHEKGREAVRNGSQAKNENSEFFANWMILSNWKKMNIFLDHSVVPFSSLTYTYLKKPWE